MNLSTTNNPNSTVQNVDVAEQFRFKYIRIGQYISSEKHQQARLKVDVQKAQRLLDEACIQMTFALREFEKSKKDHVEQQTVLQKRQSCYEKLCDDLETLRQEVSEVAVLCMKQREQTQTASGNLLRYQNAVSEVNKKIDELRVEKQSLVTSIADLKSQCEALETECRNIENVNEQFQYELGSLSNILLK